MSELADGALEHVQRALAASARADALHDGAEAQRDGASGRTGVASARYELVREIGRGGMGVVYLARDRELEREVALKVLAPELSARPGSELSGHAAADRLRREARIAAGLEHPGIVPVHDVGVLPDGRPFYVMKYVQGARLDEIVRSPLPLADKLQVFLRVCEATAYAHASGVLHRDLKPENVRVGGFGEVLVLDFGVAHLLEEAAQLPRGSIVGTPGWMAPEQERGDSDLDARTDVFALGAILRALAGGAAGHAARVLEAIASKATARAREERYASAGELAADVRAFLVQDAVSALPENFPRRVMRLASRHRVAVALVGAYLAVRVIVFLASNRS